jgi:gliding motility-associated-like protein
VYPKKRLIFFILFLFITESRAQLKLRAGESYLSNIQIIEIFVSAEDQSVWALDVNGQVYYKLSTELQFQKFEPLNGTVVKEITGFTANEMYFLIAPKTVAYFKNGARKDIELNIAGVYSINNIVAVNGSSNVNFEAFYNAADFIALTTDKHLYPIFRGTDYIHIDHERQPLLNDKKAYRVTHKGFKSIGLQVDAIPPFECLATNITFFNSVGMAQVVSALFDQSAAPDHINCTLFDYPLNSYQLSDSPIRMFAFMGTDQGLFVKNFLDCTPLRSVISGISVNALEEADVLMDTYKQKFMFAATDNGLYYTSNSLCNNYYQRIPVTDIQFSKVSIMENEKINNITTEIQLFRQAEPRSTRNISVCEKAIWLATDDGIKKIYINPDQAYYSNKHFSNIDYNIPISNNNPENPVFDLCSEQSLTVRLYIGEHADQRISIRWFKEGNELTDWAAKKEVAFTEPGIYHAELYDHCEEINISTPPITVNTNPGPLITFNYPETLVFCESINTTLQTSANEQYSYRWIKDNKIIPNATAASFTVTSPGKYRVEVSNCSGSYSSSGEVNILTASIPIPEIKVKASALCETPIHELSVLKPEQVSIKWLFNGIEQKQWENQELVTTSTEGRYAVIFEAFNCQKRSDNYEIIKQSLYQPQIIKSSDKTLCEGESIQLSIKEPSNFQYLWNTGERSPGITIKQAGSYSVTVSDETGCSMMSEPFLITFEAGPNIQVPPDSKICTIAGERLTLRAESGFRFYYWNGEKSSSPTYEVNKPGEYSLIIEDLNGCTASTTYRVSAWCEELIIPNTFTPNGDGINDLWTVSGGESYQNLPTSVYNRNGVLVYETKSGMPLWDGSYKNLPVPTGTYYFIIKSPQFKAPLKGSITVVR